MLNVTKIPYNCIVYAYLVSMDTWHTECEIFAHICTVGFSCDPESCFARSMVFSTELQKPYFFPCEVSGKDTFMAAKRCWKGGACVLSSEIIVPHPDKYNYDAWTSGTFKGPGLGLWKYGYPKIPYVYSMGLSTFFYILDAILPTILQSPKFWQE